MHGTAQVPAGRAPLGRQLYEEFRGLTNERAYVKAFNERLLCRSPGRQELFLGTDQREYFLPLLRGVVAGLPEEAQVFDCGAGAGEIVDSCLAQVPGRATIHLEEPNPRLFLQYVQRIQACERLRLGTVYNGLVLLPPAVGGGAPAGPAATGPGAGHPHALPPHGLPPALRPPRAGPAGHGGLHVWAAQGGRGGVPRLRGPGAGAGRRGGGGLVRAHAAGRARGGQPEEGIRRAQPAAEGRAGAAGAGAPLPSHAPWPGGAPAGGSPLQPDIARHGRAVPAGRAARGG
jgi:hypothetical protein